MDDSVEIIRSNKGGMKIIHKGYMYTIHKKRQSGGIRWRCTQRSLHCKGSISTGDGPPRVNMPHNHVPDPHSVAIARCRQTEEVSDISSLAEIDYDEDAGKCAFSSFFDTSKCAIERFGTAVRVETHPLPQSCFYVLRLLRQNLVVERYLAKWFETRVIVLTNMADNGPASGPRKPRKVNFTQAEMDVMIKYSNKYSKFLFCKPHSGPMQRRKLKAWEELQRSVNAVSIEERTQDEIKTKLKKYRYELFKKAKEQLSKECVNFSDTMPLQQRLAMVEGQSSPQIQIPVLPDSILKSQPLSPTKLKVSRSQTPVPKPPPVDEKPPPVAPPAEEEVCLRWNSHHSNMQTSFPSLLEREQYVDVTLATEGKMLKCHKLILSSCSVYFDEILSSITPQQHPVIFLKDIPFWILKALCDFMYAGEVHIDQSKLEELLQVAEVLKIKGLARKTNAPEQRANIAPPPEPSPPPKPKVEPLPQRPQQASAPAPTPGKTMKAQTKFVILSRQPQQLVKLAPKVTPVEPMHLLQPATFLENSLGEVPPQVKTKDLKVVVKKQPPRKLKKRKSPEPENPPLFPYRKGTRTRPQVKVPRYYHDNYEDIFRSPQSAAHSKHLAEPIIPVETIKSEPIDLEDNYLNFSESEAENPPFYETSDTSESLSTTVDKMETESQEKTENFKIRLTEKHLKESAASNKNLEVLIKSDGGPPKVLDEQPKETETDNSEGDKEMPVLSPHTDNGASKCDTMLGEPGGDAS